MSSSRQLELFAGATWDTVYRAFAQINFNASDPQTINKALRDYIRTNYPEEFNDWTVSSEFVAIIDLLSWLAGTLAFKSDIAARENFIDTAEARESILRLARFLSYNPSRCQPASGLVKLVQISTDDDVYDSFGVDLANTTIVWNDQNNSNWFEQFTMVLNNAFVSTNPFGVPLSQGTISGITAQEYRLNGLASGSKTSFSATVGGTGMDFELCNVDFTDTLDSWEERSPNPSNAMHLFYQNDGNGNSSNHTGFFLGFKQGTTQQQVFSIAVPVENQLLDVTVDNINQNDVWVQTIDQTGAVLIDWTKVPAIFNSNITYNDLSASQRNIFAVLSRDNDQVTIRFSDGRFGNAPIGLISVTFRVSNGLSYQIKPLEIDSITLPFSYINSSGVTKTLYMTFSLFDTISNAATAETIEQIRERAPQVYGTQNRMVSGEDYNTFPLSSGLAVKIKAVNRVYSGQSRYIDLADPTGTYQDLSLFADDGIFFRDPSNTYFEVPQSLNLNATQIINDYILPAIDQYTIRNLIRDVLMQNVLNGTIAASGLTWTASTASLYENTGWFSAANSLIQPGSTIQFSINGVPTWVPVLDVQGQITTIPPANTAGGVSLAQNVPTGSTVLKVLPAVDLQPSASVVTTMTTNLSKQLSFSLSYDYTQIGTVAGPWTVGAFVAGFGVAEPALSGSSLAIMNVDYVAQTWRINLLGLRYVFESVNSICWFDNGNRALAATTGEYAVDLVKIMRINRDLNNATGFAFNRDFNVGIDRLWLYPDGTPEPRRTTVVMLDGDGDGDGYPVDPDLYYKVTSSSYINTYLFWSNAASPPFDVPIYNVKAYDTEALRTGDTPSVGTVGFQRSGASYVNNNTFWVYTVNGWQQDLNGTYRVERGRGPNVAAAWMTATSTLTPSGDSLIFQWKHYATSDHRIDPAQTNIHDIFVLTSSYDTAVRQWIRNGGLATSKPATPTEFDLRTAFSSLESLKMFSDEIVWRPVQYRYLFGSIAEPELQGQFKVVRLPNASVSDGEIKTQIKNAIDAYFALSNWDFGETFYFTELAAYIHQQLAGLIGSIVLVPLGPDATFGDGFEVTCRADEIFISAAQVSDIIIIPSNTANNLRIRTS